MVILVATTFGVLTLLAGWQERHLASATPKILLLETFGRLSLTSSDLCKNVLVKQKSKVAAVTVSLHPITGYGTEEMKNANLK